MIDQDCVILSEERSRRPNLFKVAEFLASCDTKVQAAFMLFVAAASGETEFEDVPIGVIDGVCKAVKEAAE